MTIVINILNGLIRAVASVMNFIVNHLPTSPFSFIDTSSIQHLFGYVNWLIPVGTILTILGAWLSTKALYQIYSVVMRWLKLIE